MIDVARLRADTPGCAERIHLNNAGAALMPTPVVDAARSHLDLEARIGGYEAAAERAGAISSAYQAVAALLGTQPSNVAFTEHATAAFVQALSSIRFAPGDVLVTTRQDYVSNQIQYLSLAERLGIEVVRTPSDEQGAVDLEALERLVHRRRPKLVAVTHVPTNSGLVQDVGAVGRLCRARDVPLLVDACQSVGQMPVYPHDLGCDFLSATSRKFLRGPRGCGFLWVSDRVLERDLVPLFPDLRGADWIDADRFQPAPGATRFETWEFSWGLVLGTGEAARYAHAVGLDAIRERTWGLAAQLRRGLSAIRGVRVLDRGETLCGIVTATVAGHEPSDLVTRLRDRGINTSSQRAVDALIDYEDKGVAGALRISPHYYNTEEEVDGFLGALSEIVEGVP